MLALAGAACAVAAPSSSTPSAVVAQTPEEQASAIVHRMSLEHKVAQLIQPDISTITPADVERYRFGTILNGGTSGPGGNDKAPAAEWLKLADAMWEAAMRPHANGEPVVPMLWATDAVHGHNNVPGATVFPHNVGLGATRDPDLIRRIGEATATEIAVTGIDWTFAPTIAVATDTRWGRAYESYGADPAIVTPLGVAMVTGLQGQKGSADYLGDHRVIATIKHFFGDGGTGGKDQGDTVGEIGQIEAIHAFPYSPAIAAGAQTVMASFNSINGIKMHGNAGLLTGLLRGKMGFGGVVVGDWNGHGQIPGCTNSNCPQALMAGLDIYMVPEEWKALHATLVEQAKDGTIPMARIDEAATRVIALKVRAGAYQRGRPSSRPLAGKWDLLGSPDHRAIAREAVRKSLVLLKNDGVLPIRAGAKILVSGKAADDIPAQSGGWSITWQGGGDLTNADFPGATSVYAGIANAMSAAGGTAALSPDGRFVARPDVAVVVFGESPYAEFMGDRLDHRLDDEEGLKLLRYFRSKGIKTVAVLLSGRPLWINREFSAADAFVAAWLPGSEGAGVADVIVGDATGRPRHDFTGTLSFPWPADCGSGAPVLFGLGYGGRYGVPLPTPLLASRCSGVDGATTRTLFGRGPVAGLELVASDDAGVVKLPAWKGASTAGAVKVAAFDLNAQEDARTIEWTAPASLSIPLGTPVLPKGSLELRFATVREPNGAVTLSAGGTSVDVGSTLKLATNKGLRTARIPLACLSAKPIDRLTIRAESPVAIRLAGLTITPEPGPSSCQGPF